MGLLVGRPGQPKLAPFFLASLGLHVVAGVVVLVLGAFGGPRIDVDENIVKTKLVKLGKERDEKLLPRKEREKPPPPKKEEAPPTVVPEKPAPPEPAKKEPEKPAEPPPETKPSARDILETFTEKTEERPKLTDLVRETIDEGSEQGSEIGEEITGRLKEEYNDRLGATIRKAQVVPDTIDEKERLRLKAVLFVAVGADGGLLDARITRSSGNSLYDNAVLAAAKKSAPFPPPPIQVRDFYARGVQFNVCPASCR